MLTIIRVFSKSSSFHWWGGDGLAVGIGVQIQDMGFGVRVPCLGMWFGVWGTWFIVWGLGLRLGFCNLDFGVWLRGLGSGV